MKECAWYVISYFALIHLAGLGLGMFLQEKITKYSILRKCTKISDKDNSCPLLTKADVKDVIRLILKTKEETKSGR